MLRKKWNCKKEKLIEVKDNELKKKKVKENEEDKHKIISEYDNEYVA